MIDVTDPSKLLFDLQPYEYDNKKMFPTLEVLDIEKQDDYYKVKMLGQNIKASYNYQVDTSNWYNSYEIVYDVYANMISHFDVTFYLKVPKKYFNYLASHQPFPLGTEDLDNITILSFEMSEDFIVDCDPNAKYNELQNASSSEIIKYIKELKDITYSVLL